MNDLAVDVLGLSKRYRIGASAGAYGRLSESVTNAIRRAVGRAGPRDTDDSFLWALKDVSLQVRRGEAVGIVGRNGAGKSTLLKILSRITEPTAGRAELHGRVGSLLEVGTGFHPELTGRENIYLNGAIIGMRKAEIARSFDDIVAFADIERFLDTPVKRYSSGMYVRLAFGVAAYLQPEILIIDEVLAVGDAEFQRKCLGKMGDVAKEGRTVLFVSHSMAAVTRLCDRVYWLDQGRLLMEGEPDEVVSEYLTRGASVEGVVRFEGGLANPGVDELRITEVRLLNRSEVVTSTLDVREPFWIEICYRVERSLPPCRVGFAINSLQGITVFSAYDSDDERFSGPRPPGEYTARCEVPGHLLNTDQYVLSLNAGIPNVKNLVSLQSALTFEVADTGAVGSHVPARHHGVIRPRLDWSVVHVEPDLDARPEVETLLSP
jgi:lipopolysaccharide transport system ATP-binding protein